MLYLLAILFLILKKKNNNHRFHHAHQSFFSLEEGSTVSFAQNRRTSQQACIPSQCMRIYKCARVLSKEKLNKSFQKP